MNHIEINKEIAVENISYNNPYSFDKLHRHEYFELLLFENGYGGNQLIDFIEYKISSMSLFIIVPGQVHLMNRLPDENGILIQFSKSALNQSISPLKIDCFFGLLLSKEIRLSKVQYQIILPFFKRIKEIYESETTLKQHKLVRILGYILFEVFEIISERIEFSNIENIAYEFLIAVYENISTVKTVQEYAQLLNISSNKLVKKINTHLGKSPLQIIHEIMLVEIKRIMLTEQLSHKEIAFKLNFDSQSSYSRFIKKQTSLSPSLLREQLSQIAQ